MYVLVRVPIAVKRHHDHSNSYKRKAFHWDGLQSFSPLSSGHGGMQADMVLEKELRVPHLDPQAIGSEL